MIEDLYSLLRINTDSHNFIKSEHDRKILRIQRIQILRLLVKECYSKGLKISPRIRDRLHSPRDL